MESALEYVMKEWAVISQAPVTIIAMATAIFSVMHWLHRERIRSLQELVDIKNQRLREFQEKTKADTPDQARDRIESLEKKVKDISDEVGMLPVSAPNV